MSAVRTFLSRRSGKVAIGVAFVVGVALSFAPLIGIPGPESALFLGLLLPPFVAAMSASGASELRSRASLVPIGRTHANAIVAAMIVVGTAYAVLFLNSLRVGTCAPGQGALFVIMGPMLGGVLAAVVGVLCGYAFSTRRRAMLVATLVPVVATLWSVERLWHTPAVFAYGQFFGFFPGTLYDENVLLDAPYLALRLITLAWIAGIVMLSQAGIRYVGGRWRMSALPSRLGTTVLTIALLGVASYAESQRAHLGLSSDPATMKEALGNVVRGTRCDVVTPRELNASDRSRLVADCDFRVRQVEHLLGVHQRARITAFFFRNADEKRRLMGAGDTYIAKPWRNEVYLQMADWPHPVLAHEIAHVVAGNLSPGPLHVPGQLWGLLPEVGMIEGVAVALAWDEREGLTPHEWSRAMYELDRNPDGSSAFGAGFVLSPPRNAYAFLGSFYRFILERYGAAALRRAYATGDVEDATGKMRRELVAEWHERLNQLTLRPDALPLAQARFARPAIFARVCPHVVADLHLELVGDVTAGDIRRALQTCEHVLRVDPGDLGAMAMSVGLHARASNFEDAEARYAILRDRFHAPAPVLANAREAIADAHWVRGDRDAARTMFTEIVDAPRGEDAQRVVEVKLIALSAGGAVETAVRSLLANASGQAVDRAFAVHLARQITEHRSDGLGAYLEARQLTNEGHYDEAVELLRDALSRGLPSDRLRIECTRMLAIAEYANANYERSREIWQRIASDASSTEGARAEAHDWLDRFRYGSNGTH